MSWIGALIKAILEWATGEVKKDTKASDADSTPQSLRNSWRDRINRQLEKQKEQKEKQKNDKANKDDSDSSASV